LPSPMPKRAGKYRAQLVMQAAHKGVLKAFLASFIKAIEPVRGTAQLHWSLDVDPIDMF
jgi:primosomal protein N' (replication factor Y)